MRRLLMAFGVLSLVPLVAARAPAFDETPKKDVKKSESSKAKVAVFRLKGTVSELQAEDPFPFGAAQGISLKDLVSRIKKAEDDSAVKAVVLLEEGGSVGPAQIEELRQAMAQFRAAGKDIYAHADSLPDGRLRPALPAPTASASCRPPTCGSPACTARRCTSAACSTSSACSPTSSPAASTRAPPRCSCATAPAPKPTRCRTGCSTASSTTYVELIAEGRDVDAAKVEAWIDDGPYTAEKAKAAGLIDAVEHRQEFEAMLKEKYGEDVVFDQKYGEKKQPKLDFVNPFAIFKMLGDAAGRSQEEEDRTSRPSASSTSTGAIALGQRRRRRLFGDGRGAFSTPIRKALDEAAADDTIKAVVLRVDSPGGSAVASEIILDATRRVKAKKPFVVSMGNVAGSGGYYVACASDIIFADESTITGSIGVVGGKLVTTDMWEKVGITFKALPARRERRHARVRRHRSPPTEREQMQAWMDEIYGVFKGHVTAIRGNRLKKPIDELAGGRVYTGKQALELGLVDDRHAARRDRVTSPSRPS